MGLVAAKCSQCGSSIEVDESRKQGFCPYCGTKYITEDIIQNNYTTNYNTSYVTNNIGTAIIQNGDSIETLYERFLAFCKVSDYASASNATKTMQKKFPQKALSWYCGALCHLLEDIECIGQAQKYIRSMPAQIGYPDVDVLCKQCVDPHKSWQEIKNQASLKLPSPLVAEQPVTYTKNVLANGKYAQYQHDWQNAKKIETAEDRSKYADLLRYIDEVWKQDLRAQDDLRKLGEDTSRSMKATYDAWKQSTDTALKNSYKKVKGKSAVKKIVIAVVVIGVLCLAGYLAFSLLKAIFGSWF